MAEQTSKVRENFRQRDIDAAMDNYNEAGHPRASAAISIHNKCKPIKTAYKRHNPQIGFFKEENPIYYAI